MKRIYFYCIVILITIFMDSCSQKKEVDLILKNGTVYTVNDNFSVTESFAVKDEKIVKIGSNEEIERLFTSEKIIDAEGKFVYPGFNDAHCHFYGYAANLMQYANLAGTKSEDEIYEILKKHHNKFGGEWILGRGWDQNDWSDTQFPNKSKLDELFPNTPVYLIRIDGHAGWCNTKALEIAGVNSASKIDGGEVKLENGKPSGILIDRAQQLVTKYIPGITEKQQRMGLLEAQKNCFAVGLTSVTDCGLDQGTILLIDSMQKGGDIKMRVNAMLSPSTENFKYFVMKGIYKTDQLIVNTIKLFADGTLGSRGALMMEEYSDDPGNCGLQMESQDYYEKICQLAYENNFIVATHAIGDGGNRLILDTYSKFLKGKNDRRWRIEHAQIIHLKDFEKFGKFSIIPSIQATHATSDMYWAENRIGAERIKGAYAYQTLLQQNGWLPNGTDFRVENIDPLLTFYASVFRTDSEGWPEGGWRIDEGLTREQALSSITIWAAKASFEENEKGSLEPDRWADFVILDTDLMKASSKDILETKVLETWICGEKVF